jgi:hypothetical protein
MRHGVPLLVILSVSISVPAQTPTGPPAQSARQALIEMFMGKGADDFARHLPVEAQHALIRPGEGADVSGVVRISDVIRQMVAQSEHIETFEIGPNILVSEQDNGHERIEVAVEHDSLFGEDDEIELSVHVYKDGQPAARPFVPRLIFTMSPQLEIWRLREATLAAHIPLTDSDYLKGLRRQQDETNEAAARMRMDFLVRAESGYAATHPERGYACTLTNLFAPDPADDSGDAGGFFDPGQGSDEWNGYRFIVSGCDGNPALNYRITAVPVDPDSSAKTFCSDESGTLRFITSGKSSTCFSQGQAVSDERATPPIQE